APRRTSQSSASQWTSVETAVAATWDPPRSAMPAFAIVSSISATAATRAATSASRIATGRAEQKYRPMDERDLPSGGNRAHHVTEIVRVATELADRVAQVAGKGAFPVVIGGDHSMSIGTLAGIARSGRRPGVIWMDAHGDINTPRTSPSGNVHGMPFAVALGLADEPFPKPLRGSIEGRNSALMAIRDIDEGEKENIRAAGVTAITMA